MSWLYPRTVEVHRPIPPPNAGNAGYFGMNRASEATVSGSGSQPVLTGVPASIQFDTHGSRPLPSVPADTQGRTMWKIFIPKVACAPGDIQKDDIIVDDQGARYQVEAPYWNSLGYALRAELLKA